MTKRRIALASARKSAGYTQEGLAEALNVDRTTVIRWEAGDYAPLPYVCPKLARLLRQSAEQLHRLLTTEDTTVSPPVTLNPDITSACDWLDQHEGLPVGTTRDSVGTLLRETSIREFENRRVRRGQISRSETVRALTAYYGADLSPYHLYRTGNAETTILSRPGWLDLDCELTGDRDALTLAPATEPPSNPIDYGRAVQRLAEAQTYGQRFTNDPIYRLLDTDIRPDGIGGSLALTEFAHYALTLDCLESELLDALAESRPTTPGSLPLRDAYLPTPEAVTDYPARLCAGGVLALTAIARPTTHDEPDYVLLIQKRSGRVLNAAHQLAVIPKGFHQPTADYYADTRIGHSLLRELEEELFGRRDLDNNTTTNRAASPLHPNRLSEPMKWLTAEPDRLHIECTGFGINLISGNYEYACLTIIDDPDFWTHHGHQIEANWEARGLHQYRLQNHAALAALEAKSTWTNEGLFALTAGLKRLRARAGVPDPIRQD